MTLHVEEAVKQPGRVGPKRVSFVRRMARQLEPMLPASIHGVALLVYRQATNRTALPPHQLLRLWRHGFITQNYVTYQFDRNDPSEYLPDYARFVRAARINGSYKVILDNKALFHAVMNPFAEHLPRVHGIVARRGVLYASQNEAGTGGIPLSTWMRENLPSLGRIVVKPIGGSGGAGVMLLEWREGTAVVNGRATSTEALAAWCAGVADHIVTEYIHQAAYSARIFPGSVNTIRALTMWDMERDEPFLAVAVHRFGVAQSAPVDNFSQGGLSVPIDKDGVMGAGAACPKAGGLVWHDNHPDTGESIAGTVIPGWPAIRERLLEIARSLPIVPYVGWDIVVTEDGFRILEGNNCSDVNVFQVHGPLLRDPRVRRFMQAHNVIR